LLRAQSIGALSARTGGDRRAYYEALEKVVMWCSETDEGAYARDLLAALNPASIKGEKDEANASEPTEEEVVWEHKPYLEHYFGMLVPVGRGNVEELKATVSDFNKSFYDSQNLRVTANLINRNFQIILVKDFKRQDYSLEYFNVFKANNDILESINSSGYSMFTITTENYISLFKNKEMDSYTNWFEEVYLTEKE
jgi:hypothetical protein